MKSSLVHQSIRTSCRSVDPVCSSIQSNAAPAAMSFRRPNALPRYKTIHIKNIIVNHASIVFLLFLMWDICFLYSFRFDIRFYLANFK